MGMSSSVYNLNTQMEYYIDDGYWLTMERELLFTTNKLYRLILQDIGVVAIDRGDARGEAWLAGLRDWVASTPDNTFVVLNDNDHWHHVCFDHYTMVNQ